MVTPLLRFLRAITKEQRKTFAAECGTTEVYLYQLAAQPRPNPRLLLAKAIVDNCRRYARLQMTGPLDYDDLLVGATDDALAGSDG